VLTKLLRLARDDKLRALYDVDIGLLHQEIERYVRLLEPKLDGSCYSLLALAQHAQGFETMFADLAYLRDESRAAAQNLEGILEKVHQADVALASAARIELNQWNQSTGPTIQTKEINNVMGDFINAGAGAIVVNRSYLKDALNKVATGSDSEVGDAIKEVQSYIESSGNQAAVSAYNEFLKEAGQPEPGKTRLKLFWDGVVAALPSVTKLAAAVAKIVTIFA
jgi:hypothetical protein